MKKQVLVTVVALMCLIGSLGMTGITNKKVIVQLPAVVLLTREIAKGGPLAVRLVKDLYNLNLRIMKGNSEEFISILKVFALIRGPTLINTFCSQRLL
jgi:hypothetical protein